MLCIAIEAPHEFIMNLGKIYSYIVVSIRIVDSVFGTFIKK